MHGTSVVVLCFGYETHTRPWVIYELEKAHQEGRGIVAVDMSRMLNLNRAWDYAGYNPLHIAKDGAGKPLSSHGKYKTYHWIDNNGREFIDEWIEAAAQMAGR